MKKWLLTLVGFLSALSLSGQGVVLEEVLVESPTFNLEKHTVHKKGKRAPIYQYIQQNLDYPSSALYANEEGVVVVSFIVETNGTLRDISVENSVSPSLDQCVVDLVELSSGNWIPGKVGGKPTAMASKVNVNFDIKGNFSHEDRARKFLIMAIRQYDLGIAFSQNDLVSKRKASARFRRALHQLDMAQKYRPEELAIVYWQANVLEKLGDADKLAKKNQELQALLLDVREE